jgi:hypothetical protein
MCIHTYIYIYIQHILGGARDDTGRREGSRSTELEAVKAKKMLSFLADLEIEWRAVAHGSEILLQVVKYR